MARDTSFYYAFLMLPPARRRAIVAVWDFCRAVDDAVDEVSPEDSRPDVVRAQAAADIEGWRAELALCFEGGAPRTSQGRALKPVVEELRLTRQPFEDVIDGVAMDLDRDRYATFEELSQYCFRVASAVGLICVEIFGCRTPSAREYALNMGVALQLTNIIRDVGTDLSRGRVYLPREDLVRFGVTMDDLRAGLVSLPVQALLAFECARARDYFTRAARALSPAEAGALTAAEIMGAIYRELLSRIERNRYDVFSRTIRVPRPHRAWIALRTWMRTFLVSRWSRRSRSSDVRQEGRDGQDVHNRGKLT